MKKLSFILVLGVIAASCAKEQVGTVEDQTAPIVNANQVSFTATVENSDDTRSTVASNGSFSWDSSDRAAVYSHNGNRIILEPSNISGSNATFTGTLDEGDHIDENAIVVYPASRLTGASQVTFPSSYSSASATEGPTLAAKVAANKTLAFKYLAGTLRLTIEDVPSVASSFYIDTRNSDNTADVISTGVFDIDFTGTTPSLTNATSTGQNITISNSSSGSTTLYIPLPTAGAQRVYFKVKTSKTVNDNDNLEKKRLSATVSRNSYLDMSWTINPSVFFVSDMTGWDDAYKAEMTKSGTTASVTLNALANKHWRPIVVYSNYWVYYGFTGSDSGETSGTFNDVSDVSSGKMSALVGYKNNNEENVSENANYTLTFNYVTGAYSSAKNSSTGDFYTANGGYDHDTPQVMTKLSQNVAYSVRKWQGDIWAYYNNTYFSQGGQDSPKDDRYYLCVYNFSNNQLKLEYLSGSDKSFNSVSLKINNWSSEKAMTNITGTPVWYCDVDWESSTNFQFYATGNDWEAKQGAEWDKTMTNNVSYPSVTSENDGYGCAKYSVDKGKYTILYCESQKWTIFSRE